MNITATPTAEGTTYAASIDGVEVGEMLVSTDRIIQNIEVADGHRGEGIARKLWDFANAEAEVLHQLDHHRTEEGHAFAKAVGGATATAEQDYYEHCGICTGQC